MSVSLAQHFKVDLDLRFLEALDCHVDQTLVHATETFAKTASTKNLTTIEAYFTDDTVVSSIPSLIVWR